MITKVRIIPGCISCKSCENICPQIFKVNGTAEVIGNDFKQYSELVLEAAQNCPVQVIKITDSSSQEASDEKKSFSSTLLKTRKLTHNTYEFIFSAPKTPDFLPGQFATLTLNDRKGDFARCYSIKSWSSGEIVFCIKILPYGRGSEVLTQMEIGDKINISAGLGTFTLKKTTYDKLFITTGTGIAPIMAMIEAAPPTASMRLLFGVRTEDDVFYEKELRKYSNLKTEIWISQATKNFKGHHGRVTVPIKAMKTFSQGKKEIYICGNPAMVRDVLNILKKKNHPNRNISYEFFTGLNTSSKTSYSPIIAFLIPWLQRVLLIGAVLTPLQYFFPESTSFLWDMSLYTVIILMLIRPLRDIFTKTLIFSQLLPLRKELGIFSASVVATSAAIHYLDPNFHFIGTYFSLNYWSFENNKFWAHIAELSGILLLITSNTWSQELLGRYWKKIQKLSYVYFFTGAFYVWANFDKNIGLWGMIIVFTLTVLAFLKNHSFQHA